MPPPQPPPPDPVTQMNTYRSYVTMLADPNSKDELKLKAAQELSENFEVIMCSSQYPAFLDHMMKIFVKILQDGEPHFISEYNIQQVRKLILEMIHRLPTNEHLRPYVKTILSLMLKLLETENEENILVCLRIIIELHKQYRPTFNPEIQHFLQFVKSIYSELPKNLNKIFEPRPPIKVKDLSELNIESLLRETFTITPVTSEKKATDGTIITYNLIPKAVLSLKVLQELPIIVVLMYQIYKQNVHQDVADFIPLIMTTITLQPSLQHRNAPGFNKEVFVDFMGAQIKTISFLAYIIRIYQDVVATHSTMMVKGMLGLLTLCPIEVTHLRRELLIAARHILATDLRIKFVPYMERLFDEQVLLGNGWTTYESLRPLAYSTLADLVHHVRQLLFLPDLARAVHLFSKNVHDQSLPTSIQTMSCKLLLNLVECIRTRSDTDNNNQGRELLMRMLEVFVLKFKTITKLQLPILLNKANNAKAIAAAAGSGSAAASSATGTSATGATVEIKTEDTKPPLLQETEQEKEASKSKFLTPQNQSSSLVNCNVSDYRSLIKTLVCGVKTITWGCANCKSTNSAGDVIQSKQFQPRETLVFIRLVKWALQALDIYTIGPLMTNPTLSTQQHHYHMRAGVQAQPPPPQTVRTKEEKEVLEHFSGVFSMMNPQTFQEIFSTTIDYMVERIFRNGALQIVGNSFLANPTTSPIFATVLVEYLLERMDDMGSNVERSNLYLRLFKLVFGSVSLFPAENEHMLRPHLHQIVTRSMELAMSAKEPYNYFLLLRALFRSIGGGSHDLLYQEFLPLLPNLLEGLNRLQSGLHKQHMKDLFVELCLTVPVRLSSLLPYLPMLMDPLVSALNGSHNLVSQGLRTLELCVDNLQPDFLYEHIQPVRADLMQALWRTLRNPNDQVVHVAFRVLGKFGGGNRKMMIEPQRLDYNDRDGNKSPAIIIHFPDSATIPVKLPIEMIIETAFTALKSNSTDSFYRKQCWQVINCYLASVLQLTTETNTDNVDVTDETTRLALNKLFTSPSFKENNLPSFQQQQQTQLQEINYKYDNVVARNVLQTALTGLFVAAAIKELKQSVIATMVSLVRHYTIIAIAQQAGPYCLTADKQLNGYINRCQDPLVLIDALATIMGHEEKELCKPGQLALILILETATQILGSKERACQLPMMEYLAEKMCALCYERAWYSKLGGCIAIKFLFERMATKWVLQHLFPFLKALMYVMMDLTGKVSNGAIDMAKENLEQMLRVYVHPDIISASPELLDVQNKSIHDVTHELVRQVTSPHTLVREQAMSSLRLLAEIQSKSVTQVMEPHKDVLADMIPPKKHLLRHQPANAQIGLMDGNTFCTTLTPRLFTIDLQIHEHKIFFQELLSLCEQEDSYLHKLPCYKSVSNLIPLRKSALRALAACHYIVNLREKIFKTLYHTFERPNPELQQATFECMQKFIGGFQMDMETVHSTMRPMLLMLGDHRNLSLNCVKRLSYLTQLFPSTFSITLCEQLLLHLKKLLENLIQTNQTTHQHKATANNIKFDDDCKEKISLIIEIFHLIPAATPKFIDILCRLVLQTEKSLLIEASSPFRKPLMKFLLRYPTETLTLFLHDNNIKDQQWSRYLEYLIKQPVDGKVFRDVLYTNTNCTGRLITMLLAATASNSSLSTTLTTSATSANLTIADKYELQHQAIRIISVLIKFDEQWLSTQGQIVAALKQLWYQDGYLELHKRVENVDFSRWKEPKLVVKILLHYFSHHPTDIDLLFQLLRATCDRFIPDFQFLRDFLENTVAREYQVEWKRSAFFRFVEHCPEVTSTTAPAAESTLSEELRAKILQLIIIPAFAVSFERGEGVKLVGGAPMPYQDNPENVVSVFITRVIDPEHPFVSKDCLRISLLQFSCLLVEQASQHIHDVTNKRQGNKLRRLMTFAWPCLLGKNCVDPATRYHGHLLLSHIIAKFAIHKRIVLQVFHSLLKAHAVEARGVVRQALEILTPAMPVRMEDGNTMLTHWTKKIIVEEGHSMQQLIHILQLVVRHYKVYYPVRHHLVQHMVNSIQRLGFSPNATLDNRRLAVELAEVIIKWELHRIKDEAAGQPMDTSDPNLTLNELMANPVNRFPGEPSATKPIERGHADSILNFLLRLACQVNDGTSGMVTAAGAANAAGAAASTATPAATAAAIQSSGNPGELLSRRCVNLLKMALKPDVWPSSTQQQQPPPDLKLNWLDKVFASIDSAQPNYGNICTALELLTFLLGVMKREQILANFKLLQRGLSACLTSTNTKVIRLMHALMSRLMSIFPTESTVPSGVATPASKYDELNTLYTAVTNFITEGLTTYEKNTGVLSNTAGAPASNASTSLFGTLMILKAACSNNSSYIDRFIAQFGRVLHRMTKDHLQLSSTGVSSDAATSNTITDSNPVNSELLILSLDLVKNRVAVMSPDMRKSFISSILIILIEKTHDIKIMKAITRMLEEWMKNKNPIAVNQAPSLKEKSMLLVKMMQCVEKKFPDDQELNGQFLELVNYVYRDEILRTTELTSKLEPAFLSGLRCTQPHIRAKFFEVFDSSMRRRLYDRLLYIICSQSWDAMGPHYWIKQCIELVIVTASASTPIKLANQEDLLPSLSSIINTSRSASTSLISNDDADLFFTRIKKEPGLDEEMADDFVGNLDSLVSIVKDDLMDIDLGTISADISMEIDKKPSIEATETINQLIIKQDEFLQTARKVKTEQFLLGAAQLCHMDTSLAERVWLDIFPRLWAILDETQHAALTAEIVPFVCSGAHVIQKDCHPSAIATFVEAISHCDPPVPIRPPLIKYLGRSHNLWHRMTLTLEKMAFENGDLNNASDPGVNANANASANANNSSLFSDKRDMIPTQSAFDCYDFEPADAVTAANNPHAQILDSLADMYALLCEEDMWCGLWQKHAHYKETVQATSLEQQGFFEQAQVAYDLAMTKFKQDYIGSPAPFKIQRETLLWEQHWIRCAKELNQWDLLFDYGQKKTEKNPFLILESSWRQPDWVLMKEALAQVEHNCPKEMAWRVNLYRGFLAICHNEDQHLNTVERYVEMASSLCMREWRRLPAIVSHIHLPLLQAAQQIMELQEAMQIHQGLLHGRSTASSLHDMKAIVKTWRNRLPVIADDLSHWSDIFTWRQHHYTFISSHYDAQQQQQQQQQQDPANAQSTTTTTPTVATNNHSMLGVHASAQAIIHFGKIARKHNLTGVCLDSLSRIYTIPSVPIVDCFQKIRQQVKCYLQMAAVSGNNELQEGLEVIESTNLKYFTKEMTAEFYALKGMLLSQIGRSDDANKAFSAAVQLHDTLVKAWALWGDYLEQIFTRDSRQQIGIGVSAITCFLHACRHQNESKSRKYLAKVLWLLTYDDEKGSLMEAVEKYAVGVPPIQWLPWIPQLLMCLIRNDGVVILNLLSQVGRMFPQAVYFSIRTLYLTLKIEQRERYKSAELQQQSSTSANINPNQVNPPASAETGPIRATPPMWRCSKIMHMQRDIHPTILSSLEGIVDQMVWFRESWYEEVLRQLRQGLAKCYAIAFENRGAVSEATITPHTLNFVKKLVATFGIGIENISSTSSQATSQTFGSAASESLARRAQATEKDPVFKSMKGKFSSDFDFTEPGAKLLHNLISKLKKWIKILEGKTRQLPKSFLIEEKCRFLSNFSLKTAEVELPGEFLLPKHSHYYVRIARFMPRVEVVQRHNTAARRLRIRGHNGKLYPYLVVNDAGLGDARREERVLQLLRMLNYYLAKQKETSRRFLHFTVPRVVAVSPQMRLVEDNPASTSLLDIYKLGCAKMNGNGTNEGMDHDAPIARYYEKLAVMQAKGAQASHQMLRDILKHIQSTMIPRTMMKSWAVKTFPVATDYWTFRKMFTLQLALACFAEYVLHLTRLNPDMMYIHQDSGLVNIAYFKFDVDDMSGELDAQRPVPFRLTPNILDFITTTGVSGPLTASAIAIARCLVHPSFKVHTILRAILRDEVIADHNRKQEDAENSSQAPADMKGELLITMVTRAVTAIMTRLNSLANFADNGEGNKVSTLVAAASSHDNLCRMDPSWHPWL